MTDHKRGRSVTRRRALTSGALASALAVAGCLDAVDRVGESAGVGDGRQSPTAGPDDGTGEPGNPASETEVAVQDMPNPAFAPRLVHVEPGGTVRWIVDGHRHTVTAYHPETYGPKRCPDGAEPFDSGLLARNREFEWAFDVEGVYDYVDTRTLCATHEALGAVGRVVVGWPDPDEEPALSHDPTELQGRATSVMEEIDAETLAVLEDG